MASPPSPHSPSTQHPAHALLSRAHSPTTTQRIFDERVSQRPLLLRPSSPEISARATRRKALAQKKALEKRRSALKPRPLSAAEKRKLGLYDIPKEQRVYKVYEGLHSLWLGYIREILGLKGSGSNGSGSGIQYITPNGAGPLLASADMHGALVRVTRSKCVSRVGLRGIVIRDSKSAFEIITKENQIKCEQEFEDEDAEMLIFCDSNSKRKDEFPDRDSLGDAGRSTA